MKCSGKMTGSRYKKILLIFVKERDLDEFHQQLRMTWIKNKSVKNIKMGRLILTTPNIWGKYKYQMSADVKTDSARDYCLLAKDFHGRQSSTELRI